MSVAFSFCRALRVFVSLLALVCAFNVIAANDLAITSEELAVKIQDTEANAELEDADKAALVGIYRSVQIDIDAYKRNQQATRKFTKSIAEAPLETAKLEREIASAKENPYESRIRFKPDASIADIEQRQLKEKADLTAVETDYNSLRKKLEEQQSRVAAARKELAEANSQLSAISDAVEPIVSAAAGQQLQAAVAMQKKLQSSQLDSRIKMLDQELLSHGPRTRLLKAQVERRAIALSSLQRDVEVIEGYLSERRQQEADQAMQMTMQAQLTVQDNPVLEALADKNAEISKLLSERSLAIENANNKVSLVVDTTAELEGDFASIRKKLDIAGLNRALGTLLQEQRENLPSKRKIQSQLQKREQIISDIALQQLMYDDLLREIEDRSDYVLALTAALEPEQRNGIDKPLALLIDQQVDLVSKLSASSSTYLQILSDLDFEQRKLLVVVGEYDAFLAERLLWVRSVPVNDWSSLLSLSSVLQNHLAASEFATLWQNLFYPEWTFIAMLVLLCVPALVISKRGVLKEQLALTGEYVGSPHDSLRSTLKAFVLTLVLSAGPPAMFFLVGLNLHFAQVPNLLTEATANALLWVAKFWFLMRVFQVACIRAGLMHRHFNWPESIAVHLRAEFRLLFFSFLPAAFVTVFFISLDPSASQMGVARITLAITTFCFAFFFLRLLGSKSGFMAACKLSAPRSLLVRWRVFWLGLAVLIPLLLTGFTIAGYVYTAGTLLASLIETFCVLLWVIILHQLIVRWLLLTATRLEMQVRKDEMQKRLEELGQDSGDEAIEYEPPRIDVDDLGRDSVQLVNIVVSVVAISLMVYVWTDILPAFGLLEQISLWTYTSVEAGETIVQAVTLVDVAVVILALIATWLVLRNVPSMLELFMLQVLSLSPSDRYTIITLTRYTVVAVAVMVISSMLGLGWDKLQWLAAALSVGIGFGLQEIVANFISGLIILFERPIRVGDRVTVGDADGIVTRIRIRATTILTWDRQEMLVPNKEFITGRLLNWSLSDQMTRLVIEIGVAYGSDVPAALRILSETAENHDKVLHDPAPFVTFERFGDSALILKLRCYLDDVNIRLSTTSALNEEIDRRFKEEGIVIAFQQQDIHFDADAPLNIKLQKDAG